MVKVIVKVIIGLLALCYGALFLSWNMGPQEIISWQMGGWKYSQPLPLGTLPFIGLVVGAVIMAIAAWSAWAVQKGAADRATGMVKKAKAKLQAQLDTINELRAEAERLKSEMESLRAGDGTWGQTNAASVEAPGKAGATVTDAAAEPPGDDDEII